MDKMINAMIEAIYNEFVREGDYSDLPEATQARDNTYNLYWDNPKFEDIRHELDAAIGQSDCASEKQGFIYGFKKAMELFSQNEKAPYSATNTTEGNPPTSQRATKTSTKIL